MQSGNGLQDVMFGNRLCCGNVFGKFEVN